MLRIYPYRDVVPSFLAISSLVFVSVTSGDLKPFFLIGIVLFAWMRVWTRTWIGLHTRSKNIDVPELIEQGPFQYSRNPLYIANLGSGICFMLFLGLPSWWVLVGGVLLFLNWHFTIQEEEVILREEFSEYSDYCNRVPRYLSIKTFHKLKLKKGAQSPMSAFKEDHWTWIWQMTFLIMGVWVR